MAGRIGVAKKPLHVWHKYSDFFMTELGSCFDTLPKLNDSSPMLLKHRRGTLFCTLNLQNSGHLQWPGRIRDGISRNNHDSRLKHRYLEMRTILGTFSS